MANSEADKRFEKTLRALGYAVLRIQRAAESPPNGSPRVDEFRVKLDADNRTSVLAIVKATGEKGPLVAFVGGPDMETVVYATGKRLKAGTLKWREDRPWGS